MRGRMVVMGTAVAVALAASAGAAHEEQLDRDGLNVRAKQNRALARYIKYNGYPDMAEVKVIADQPPWDDHEVTLYYFKHRKEISFARARVLGRPDVHSTRYERVLTDADIRALRAHGTGMAAASTPAAAAADTVAVSECKGSAVARAECAAGRAEQAADRVEVAAVRAETAAEKTGAIVDKMGAHQARKHVRR
jgi:hypothetical protein